MNRSVLAGLSHSYCSFDVSPVLWPSWFQCFLLHALVQAHGEMLLYVRFMGILDGEYSDTMEKLLKACVKLYGLWRIEQNALFFLEVRGYLRF